MSDLVSLDEKRCSRCKEVKPLDSFSGHSRDGKQSWCRQCCTEYQRLPERVEYRKEYSRRESTRALYRLREKRHPERRLLRKNLIRMHWELALVMAAKSASKTRGHSPPTIDKEWVCRQFEFQRGLCHWTGVKMLPSRDRKRDPFRPSLDRIDINIGYTRENTVLVCQATNYARNDNLVSTFLEWLDAVKKIPDTLVGYEEVLYAAKALDEATA